MSRFPVSSVLRKLPHVAIHFIKLDLKPLFGVGKLGLRNTLEDVNASLIPEVRKP